MMPDLLMIRAAFRDVLRAKRLFTIFLLVLLPPTVALLLRLANGGGRHFHPVQIYDKIVADLVLSFTLALLSVTYGTGVVAQEVEQGTITYLLNRPLPRWRILLAKSLVGFVVVTVVSALATVLVALVLLGPSHFSRAGVLPDLAALAMGAVAYVSLFVLAGVVIPRPLIYSLLFVFGWETIVPILPGSFARLSIMTYLRVIATREVSPTALANTQDNPAQALLFPNRGTELHISSGQAWLVLILVSLVALVTSFILFSKREYIPREED